MSADKRRTVIMRLPLADLTGWHMLVTCPACADERTIAIGTLVKLTVDATTMISAIPRLRRRAPPYRQAHSRNRVQNR